MNEPPDDKPPDDEPLDLGGDVRTPAHPRHDRDIDLRAVIGFVGGLAMLLVASSALCWGLYVTFRERLVRGDPPPSPLPAANVPVVPPEPRLQLDPKQDMAGLRARDEAILDSHGWVDRRSGIARIPIARAIELSLSPGQKPALTDEAPDGGAVDGGHP